MTAVIWGFTGVCVCVCLGGCRSHQDFGNHWSRARQSGRPDQTWLSWNHRVSCSKLNIQTNKKTNTNKGNNRKIQIDSSFHFRGEGLPSFHHGSIPKRANNSSNCNVLSMEYNTEKKKSNRYRAVLSVLPQSPINSFFSKLSKTTWSVTSYSYNDTHCQTTKHKMVYLFICESRDSVLVSKFHIVWNQYKYTLKR